MGCVAIASYSRPMQSTIFHSQADASVQDQYRAELIGRSDLTRPRKFHRTLHTLLLERSAVEVLLSLGTATRTEAGNCATKQMANSMDAVLEAGGHDPGPGGEEGEGDDQGGQCWEGVILIRVGCRAGFALPPIFSTCDLWMRRDGVWPSDSSRSCPPVMILHSRDVCRGPGIRREPAEGRDREVPSAGSHRKSLTRCILGFRHPPGSSCHPPGITAPG